MDTGLDQNETEFAILVLAVALKVLADGDSLLDQKVQVLRDLRGEAYKKRSLCQPCYLTKQRQLFKSQTKRRRAGRRNFPRKSIGHEERNRIAEDHRVNHEALLLQLRFRLFAAEYLTSVYEVGRR